MLGVDAANWPFPWGWGFRNVWGNLVASVLWTGPPFVLGAVYGKRRARKTDDHSEWMASHMASLHVNTTGIEVDPHPRFDVSNGNISHRRIDNQSTTGSGTDEN